MPPNTIKVARPSKWGNPFIIGRNYGSGNIDAETAVRLFRIDKALDKMKEDAKSQLRGKNLACFCPLDKPCHADVLLEIANK